MTKFFDSVCTGAITLACGLAVPAMTVAMFGGLL